MFKNYLLTAWRVLLKNKVFSIINISGLALGLACSLFIFLWVQDEYGVDAFHADTDRIYTVVSREYVDNKIIGSYDTPGMLGEELPRVMPEVQYACNYSRNGSSLFAAKQKKLQAEGNYAGVDFFRIFSYPLLAGTAANALKNPESIAISATMARNFFGEPSAAINQTIRFDNYKDLKVTAVFKDLPSNSSEHFDYLLTWQLFIERNNWATDWNNSGPLTFIKLTKTAKPALLETKLQHLIAAYDAKELPEDRLELGLQRYDEMYLNSNFKNGFISGGRIDYVRLFSIVAVFILLIACINFMNLGTARSLKRSKEIGVRKVIGALRFSLIKQFLGEAVLYAIISVLISLLVVAILLPGFNNLTGKQIQFPLGNLRFWLSVAALTLVTGFMAGSYPALLLSSFQPITVLKNALRLSTSSTLFRKGLVVFQFTLSIIFITGMIIISKQVDYIQTKNIGYQRNNLVYLPLTGDLAKNFSVFKIKALQLPGISSIAKMSHKPVQIDNSTGGVDWDGKAPGTQINFTEMAAGYDFAKTMQLQIIQGRDFSKDFADSSNYLINEAALARIGYKEPIGKPLTFWKKKGTIIGVIKDFHFNSLHTAITPIVVRLTTDISWGTMLVRIEPGKTKQALEGLEKLQQELNPSFPFSYQFADQEYALLYKSEMMVEQLSRWFSFLAIFISCLGLLGLVLFTAEQRTREIGIRKVLGASVISLFRLLSKDFLVLVLLALLIATPLAWWSMNTWLQHFVYRASISWTVFAIAGLAAVIIAMATISFQAIKAASANPVKSLRSE